ncbi:hypothetical protein SmJEL517_g02802 [Synchytrium microbalum]|uniref:C2H2-type domain-containing protein n=1 Tax=Synchytrium microbalum TaxID=1806994 RepID=A0A507C5W1_9FUNG|nr:uncharacterized protein SmJEL517_g02802 [Synchytrium microbalum]TPX34489.1 hypothetical protein SmJEL517_g02802 [Synchytrium microbalum]
MEDRSLLEDFGGEIHRNFDNANGSYPLDLAGGLSSSLINGHQPNIVVVNQTGEAPGTNNIQLANNSVSSPFDGTMPPNIVAGQSSMFYDVLPHQQPHFLDIFAQIPTILPHQTSMQQGQLPVSSMHGAPPRAISKATTARRKSSIGTVPVSQSNNSLPSSSIISSSPTLHAITRTPPKPPSLDLHHQPITPQTYNYNYNIVPQIQQQQQPHNPRHPAAQALVEGYSFVQHPHHAHHIPNGFLSTNGGLLHQSSAERPPPVPQYSNSTAVKGKSTKKRHPAAQALVEGYEPLSAERWDQTLDIISGNIKPRPQKARKINYGRQVAAEAKEAEMVESARLAEANANAGPQKTRAVPNSIGVQRRRNCTVEITKTILRNLEDLIRQQAESLAAAGFKMSNTDEKAIRRDVLAELTDRFRIERPILEKPVDGISSLPRNRNYSNFNSTVMLQQPQMWPAHPGQNFIQPPFIQPPHDSIMADMVDSPLPMDLRMTTPIDGIDLLDAIEDGSEYFKFEEDYDVMIPNIPYPMTNYLSYRDTNTYASSESSNHSSAAPTTLASPTPSISQGSSRTELNDVTSGAESEEEGISAQEVGQTPGEALAGELLRWLDSMAGEQDSPVKHRLITSMVESYPTQELRALAKRLGLVRVQWHFCTVQGCYKTFTETTQLNRHIKEGHTIRLYCTVPNCFKAFTSQEKLNIHRVSQHPEPSICTFEGCGKSFPKLVSLKAHMTTQHAATKPFTCPIEGCGKAFYRKDNMQTHVRNSHPQPGDVEAKEKAAAEAAASNSNNDSAAAKHKNWTRGMPLLPRPPDLMRDLMQSVRVRAASMSIAAPGSSIGTPPPSMPLVLDATARIPQYTLPLDAHSFGLPTSATAGLTTETTTDPTFLESIDLFAPTLMDLDKHH